MRKIINFLTCLLFLLGAQKSFCQTAGDYQAMQSGDWSSPDTWQKYNGSAWVNATTAPGAADGVITIRNGSTVTASTNITADQVVIFDGSTLYVTGKFTLHNGADSDILCYGQLYVEAGGVIDVVPGDISTISYPSNSPFINNGGVNPFVTFTSTDNQVIDGNGYFDAAVSFDNSANFYILGSPSFKEIHFITGKITVTGALVITQFFNGFTGQGAGKFIIGKVDCIVYDKTPSTFNLPIGTGSQYLPLTFKVTQDTVKENHFTIGLVKGNHDSLKLPTTLDRVSTIRFYRITQPDSISHIKTASLQLTYTGTDAVKDPENLRIAKTNYSDSSWLNLGGKGAASHITTTINFTSPGDFIFANATGGGNPLPLQLITFTGSLAKKDVLLTWSSASEINTNYFIVERSFDIGNTWAEIGKVAAKGLPGTNDYNTVDANVPANTTLLYRLREYDADGRSYLSKTVLVKTGDTEDGLSIYPNPVSDVLVCTLPKSTLGNNSFTLTVTATDGKVIFRQKNSAAYTFVPVKALPAGTYFITFVNNQSGQVTTKKFIKLP